MTGLPLPYAAEKSLTYLGAISTPMALLMIGARMVDNSVKGEGKAIRLALLFKLILGPVVMTLLANFPGHADGRNRDGVHSVCSADGHECVYYDQEHGR